MNELKIKGKVILALDPLSGEGQNGAWTNQTFIMETGGEYPKKIAIDVFNSKISLEVGKECTVYFNVESREYNDRWYTNVKGWKVENEAAPEAAQPMTINTPIGGEAGHEQDLKPVEKNDLPW